MKLVLQTIQTLLSTQFTTTFKKYVLGVTGLTQIPRESLPALVISGVRTRIKNSGTKKDDHEFVIQVSIIDDKRRYFDSTSGNATQQDSILQHYDWMEERNSDMTLKASTIASVIRKNIQLSQKVLFDTDLEIEYGDAPDGTRFASTITFVADHRVTRPT